MVQTLSANVNFDGTSGNIEDGLDFITLDQKLSIIIGENAGQKILPTASTNDELNIFIGHNSAKESYKLEETIIIGHNAGKKYKYW